MDDFIDVKSNPNYQVNNLGQVRRKCCTKKGKDGKTYRRKPMMLRPYLNTTGYFAIDIAKRHHLIHRLIAEHFIPNPLHKKTVNHINGIKTDNRVENLEWNTQSENNQHAYDSNLKKGHWLGKHSPLAKRVGKFNNGVKIAEYPSARFASIQHGRCAGAVAIAIGMNRKLCGFTWAYL